VVDHGREAVLCSGETDGRGERERESSLFPLVACTHIGKNPSTFLAKFFCQTNTVANCERLMITKSIASLIARDDD